MPGGAGFAADPHRATSDPGAGAANTRAAVPAAGTAAADPCTATNAPTSRPAPAAPQSPPAPSPSAPAKQSQPPALPPSPPTPQSPRPSLVPIPPAPRSGRTAPRSAPTAPRPALPAPRSASGWSACAAQSLASDRPLRIVLTSRSAGRRERQSPQDRHLTGGCSLRKPAVHHAVPGAGLPGPIRLRLACSGIFLNSCGHCRVVGKVLLGDCRHGKVQNNYCAVAEVNTTFTGSFSPYISRLHNKRLHRSPETGQRAPPDQCSLRRDSLTPCVLSGLTARSSRPAYAARFARDGSDP